jgi:protein-S-isoprenylcysteine O-methyltransferase Ste14
MKLHGMTAAFFERQPLHLLALAIALPTVWLISRAFGPLAFPLYGAVFMAFLVARIVAILLLAIASRDTLPVNLVALRWLAGVVAIPFAYLAYSVVSFFTISRAMGADHFKKSYRSRPLENRGIYRFTSNGMYIYGMMVLYLPALWYASRPALVAAVFGHLYIWVHYFTTEKPDMRRIYGSVVVRSEP